MYHVSIWRPNRAYGPPSLTIGAKAWVVAAVLVAGCQTGHPPSESPAVREACIKPSGERVQAIAWSPDAATLVVMHGRNTAASWTIELITAGDLRVARTIDAPGALGPLTVDDRGEPIWLASDAEGAATTLMTTVGNEVTGSALGELEHPRLQRLIWTTAGLRAVEYSSTAPAGSEPPDAARLVEVKASSGRVELVPITEFDRATVDAAISLDGATTATARSTGGSGSITVAGALDASRQIKAGIAAVDVWVAARVVGYRGDDGHYRYWHADRDSEQEVASFWAAASALSSSGRVALAEITVEEGPTGRVCVFDPPSLK